ncbi:MAG: SMC-Scp complex subunit ScpB [candidate division WOR-3 bacterium]|nr:SMC-Scp complex subunit ScpB [candidate division WOR-3 bacterium]
MEEEKKINSDHLLPLSNNDQPIAQDLDKPTDIFATQQSNIIRQQSGDGASSVNQPETTPTLKNIVEALLFAADSPLTLSKLIEITNRNAEDIMSVIEELNQEYEASKRTFRIEKVAQGFQLYTLPQYSIWVRALYKVSHQRLSRAALETLSIIVYNQPVTRPEIEKIRGVDCTGPIVTLLERKLIRICGRAKKPGAPFLYGTSKEFLRYFGLQSLDDLPRKEELEEFLQRRNEE